jgi:hypothetical protein
MCPNSAVLCVQMEVVKGKYVPEFFPELLVPFSSVWA